MLPCSRISTNDPVMMTSPPQADQKEGQEAIRGQAPPLPSDAPGIIEMEKDAALDNGPGALRTHSHHTIDHTESGVSRSDSKSTTPSHAKPQVKWYRRLNPLRLRQAPPVPTEREVSKEYGAGFFSIITFQWMSTMMTVRYPLFLPPSSNWGRESRTDWTHRPATYGGWS